MSNKISKYMDPKTFLQLFNGPSKYYKKEFSSQFFFHIGLSIRDIMMKVEDTIIKTLDENRMSAFQL